RAWQTALPAAGRLPHPAAAHAHRRLGHAAARRGDHERAHTHLRCALHQYAEAGDPVGQAHTHHALAVLSDLQGRPEEALGLAQPDADTLRAKLATLDDPPTTRPSPARPPNGSTSTAV